MFNTNKHVFIFLLFLGLSTSTSVFAAETPATPTDYQKLNWIGEAGITSYMKALKSVGYIDYLTVIDLEKNDIKALSSQTKKTIHRPAIEPFVSPEAQDWLFAKDMVELFKVDNPEAKFIWNAPFFTSVEGSKTQLSLGLRSVDEAGIYITSGARIQSDVEQSRRMLIINNKKNTATISPFEGSLFLAEGDQAVEGFHPLENPDFKGESASRLYLGVRNNGKELVVYCSKKSSKKEASNALLAAGVLLEHQLHVDRGGSGACGYNLPGQYFVEPGRALPHIMAAIPSLEKGTITIDNLNVRTGPGTSNSAVRKLAVESEVTVYEELNNWLRISDTDWVFGEYIQ